MASNALIDSLALAIARMEGYLDASGAIKSGTIAYRNNNPGNLRSWGNNPVVGGYASFPTASAGWVALKRQIELNIGRGLTLEEFFGGKPGVYGGYAPGADNNNPAGYAANVAQWTGIPLGKPLNQVGVGSGAAGSGGGAPAQTIDPTQTQAPYTPTPGNWQITNPGGFNWNDLTPGAGVDLNSLVNNAQFLNTATPIAIVALVALAWWFSR